MVDAWRLELYRTWIDFTRARVRDTNTVVPMQAILLKVAIDDDGSADHGREWAFRAWPCGDTPADREVNKTVNSSHSPMSLFYFIKKRHVVSLRLSHLTLTFDPLSPLCRYSDDGISAT